MSYRKLVANDEDSVRLAAGTHPANTFHLAEDCLLKLHFVVAVPFGAHAPPHGVPFEDDTVLLVVAIVVE